MLLEWSFSSSFCDLCSKPLWEWLLKSYNAVENIFNWGTVQFGKCNASERGFIYSLSIPQFWNVGGNGFLQHGTMKHKRNYRAFTMLRKAESVNTSANLKFPDYNFMECKRTMFLWVTKCMMMWIKIHFQIKSATQCRVNEWKVVHTWMHRHVIFSALNH